MAGVILAFSDNRGFGLRQNVIDLRDVELALGAGASRVQVLTGVNFAVDRGESVAILGPSGSGKSTLLMVIAGLEAADRGSVRVAGTEIGGLGEDALARFRGRNVGIVFQSFHLIANMTALENVAVPLELAGQRDAFDRARDELRAVGLGERLQHYPGQLSGGEQQRVAIARALAPEPAILVADEPTGNLDGETGGQIADLIFSTQKHRKTTLLLVTHDTRLASRCGRVVRMRSGAIEAGAETLAAQ
jgi:putative ABC transport system ATP-binding protein